ncbi:sugar ABC transporter ATP-binding protein [Desulfobacula sp.]|uniref:sugar ABC transporter ATP-binding protein n=1 Tax=Desulfobacula sp. TaxID=2593537 RepID=UPI001EC39C18|nr:sugar ABC transporter ATP-binding protein [Desulfobacula sp.]
MANQNILKVRKLTKRFPGTLALDAVDFNLCKGEIHALVGENGAGKSTLIKAINGLYKYDSGTVFLDGTLLADVTPQETIKKGISTVYQTINLLPNLSVAENIYAGREPMGKTGIDWKQMNSRADALLRRMGIEIDVTQKIAGYSVALQQMTAIARALDIDAKVLILDEPTSSLDETECEELFALMREMKKNGLGIIFITHFLDQVYEVSDKITVLRDGKLVGEYPAAKIPKLELVARMLGRDVQEVESMKKSSVNRTIVKDKEKLFMEVKGLDHDHSIHDFDLMIHKGEVVSFAGLLGSGRTETAKLLFGIDIPNKGTIKIKGKRVKIRNPKQAVNQGIGYCPEDRRTEGLILGLTMRENLILALQAKQGIFKPLKLKQQQQLADKYIKEMNIKTSGHEQMADNLSGGNQQKVILSRWLALNPELLILDEPTHGIDVGAKVEIEKIIQRLKNDDKAVLFISSELEEIERNADRVVLLIGNKSAGELTGDEVTEDKMFAILAHGGVE